MTGLADLLWAARFPQPLVLSLDACCCRTYQTVSQGQLGSESMHFNRALSNYIQTEKHPRIEQAGTGK